MRQRNLRLLIKQSSITRFIFLLYYSYIARTTIAAIKASNSCLENTVNDDSNTSTYQTVDFLVNSNAIVEPATGVQVDRAIISNLEENFASVSTHSPPLKIMPLGDSITTGIRGRIDRFSGGYRTELWNKFVADGLRVEFVGSQASGPDNLGNKNHEGHAGWTIRQITASVAQWLVAEQPDLILLMIGTNDASIYSLKSMLNNLSNLIDLITTQSPHAQLLVASIPPIHPSANHPTKCLRAVYFNIAIPDIVSSKVAQGKKVDFVDMRSLTVNDLTSSLSPDLDNGLHPNAQGYRKIANLWHDAVLNFISKQETRSISAC